MLEFGYSRWRKLDNAALVFPAVTGKNDTRVFRVYCRLKETVEPEILQKALDITMEKYPLYQAVLRKGLFWYYLERRDIQPLVKPETEPPCSDLYVPDQKSLLFQVTYYKDRIQFEVFHALTDGTGSMHFIQELVKQYLMLAHPKAQLPDFSTGEESTGKEQEEDSFSQYYQTELPKNKEKKKAAAQLKGEKLPQDEMHIMEVILSVKETLKTARENGVTITVLLASALLWAIHEEIPASRLKRPVTLMVPVNLRNYFDSKSMANFFGWIEVGYVFKENTTFDEVMAHVKKEFERELMKERIAVHMNDYVRLEKNPLIRAIPLEVKKFGMMAGAKYGARSITGIYSNVGIFKFPEEYGDYIQYFGFLASTYSMQLCSCSYKDNLVLGFTSKIPGDSIQRNFLKILKEKGLSYEEVESDFPGYKKEKTNVPAKVFQTFTFLCIAAVIISTMVNYMVSGNFTWCWAAGAASLSAWLLVSVAYRKRRNILKNAMWQLLLVTVLGIFWDIFTGWHNWSLNFLFPGACLTVLCSMPAVSRIQRLEVSEYLFYLIQACAAGCIPLILVALHFVTKPYLSILCSGISILILLGMFIFQRKNTFREFHKKFRM